MKINEKLINRNYIVTAEMAQTTLQLGGTGGNSNIPLKIGTVYGDRFSLSNGGVKLLNEVKKVKVSASFNAQMPSAGNVCGQLFIKNANGDLLATTANAANIDQYNFFAMSIPSKVIAVENNDVLFLDAFLSKQGTAHEDAYGSCYMTIEIVE